MVRAMRCVRFFAEIAPTALGDLDAVVLGGFSDVGEGELPVRFRDVLDLVEARQGVADVRRVGQRFFALLGKGVHAIGQRFTVGGTQLAMLAVWFPRRLVCHADKVGKSRASERDQATVYSVSAGQLNSSPRPGLSGTTSWPSTMAGSSLNRRCVQGMYSTVSPFGIAATRWTWISGIRWLTTGILNASAMPATFSHWVMPPTRSRSIITTSIERASSRWRNGTMP